MRPFTTDNFKSSSKRLHSIGIAVAATLAAAPVLAQKPPVTCPTPPASESRPWLNKDYAPACRARYVLQQLKTVDDKFAFLASSGGGRANANARNVMTELGLVRGRGSDGPAGVRGTPTATAFPTPLSLAANFDPAMATHFGDLMGQDFVAAGLNSMLGPAMDIPRTWHFGRTTESFGEDPFLVASTVAPEIAAIQAHHVVTTMKHYAAYTQEQGRSGDQPTGERPAVNEDISERALREIYLPGFHAAVVKGGAGAVMCSFPHINGTYACENPLTLNILKNEWGFDGYVTPDFPDAQRSIIPAFMAGLDSGTLAPVTASPNGQVQGNAFTGQKSLRQGVDDGEVPVSRLDDIILRRLTSSFRVGVFDYPSKKVEGDVSTPERRAATVEIITGGAVLLKNDKSVLPFGPAVKTIALIGPQATDKAIAVEQGSPYVEPMHLAPVLKSVEDRAGHAIKVSYSAGTLGLSPLPVVPTAMLKTPSGQPGVLAEYFANPKSDFAGKPLATRVEPTIDLSKVPDIPGLPANLQWSVRYTAMFTPAASGIQHLTLNGSSEGALYVDNKFIGRFLRDDFQDTVYANVPMTAGKPVQIRVEYGPREAFGTEKRFQFGINFGPYVTLGYSAPNDLMAQAVETARHADVAVVFAGMQVGEGMDRQHLTLASDQDALIEAIAKANPHTVVVLNTGGAVTMPWLNQVAAVLETWLPGDSIGPATAKLLFGDAAPGGRLPITFPADETQGPGTKESEYPGTAYPDGSLDTAHFDEGLLVGYRYWDQYNQKPLFPFGYGLSYTTFSLKGNGAKPAANGGATVDATIKNTGVREGSDVLQVYLGFPKSAGEPPKQLKAFQKVQLKPGGEKAVTLTLDPDAFKYWNDSSHSWTTAPGIYTVMLGRSSRDIVWTGQITPANP